MKKNLHTRLSAVENRKESKRINEITIVYAGCRCGRDYPELFTSEPVSELPPPEQESNSSCILFHYHKEVPIDSVKKCIEPNNADNQECKFGLPLE